VNAGPARHRIIFRPLTASTGQSGQDAHISTTGSFSRWGHVKSIRGKIDDDGIQQTEGKRYFQIRVRYDPLITYDCDVYYKSWMRIERIDNVREVNHELILYAFEVDL
jgi:hypothetical protein